MNNNCLRITVICGGFSVDEPKNERAFYWTGKRCRWDNTIIFGLIFKNLHKNYKQLEKLLRRFEKSCTLFWKGFGALREILVKNKFKCNRDQVRL